MRRSQEVALGSRPYAFAALDLLMSLGRIETIGLPPLLHSRAVKRRAYVLVTSDKGLAGSFNSAVIREFEHFSRQAELDFKSDEYTFIAVGQKAAQYLEKKTGEKVTSFVRVGDFTTLEQIQPISDFLVKGYLNESWDQVTVFSTHFRSALKQEVFRRQVLPVDIALLKETAEELAPKSGRYANIHAEEDHSTLNPLEYIIEPTPETILASLSEHLVTMEIYHLILEANASEHAARRMAMKSASDNAQELAGELTVAYNKSRQAAITTEIIEIVAGAESL
jgi:F-type H+-transporting ATPase subunit gamma